MRSILLARALLPVVAWGPGAGLRRLWALCASDNGQTVNFRLAAGCAASITDR